MNAPYPMGSFAGVSGVPATPSRSRPSGPAPTGLPGFAASITDAHSGYDPSIFDQAYPSEFEAIVGADFAAERQARIEAEKAAMRARVLPLIEQIIAEQIAKRSARA